MIDKVELMIDVIEDLIQLLEENGTEDALAIARLLYVRLRQPHAYVTVTGETSTGKSSLINGLFQRNLLPVAASPTTATVTHIVCKEESEDQFYAIYRNATQEQVSAQQFTTLSITPAADLLRLQVRSNPVEKRFLGFQVFDTPGYNAMLSEHEEVLRGFLPQSDVIVFVAGFRSGFGQVDQDLLELIRSSVEGRDEIPVLLVINRAPAGTVRDNSRVKEIYDNAKDCLKCEPKLILIESQMEDSNATTAGTPAIPKSMPVWDAVAAVVSDPVNIETVHSRLLQLLQDLLDEIEERLIRREIELSADEDDMRAIAEQKEALANARDQSLAAVDRLGSRLVTQLPKTLVRAVPKLNDQMSAEIFSSDKWLGAQDCAEWIAGHALPFAAREATRSIEEQIALELQELNRELEDIANTAIDKIVRQVHIKSDAPRRFAKNLADTLLKRFMGAGVNNILRGFGGVGGAAAGTGNLVKMAVSRIGKAFGKTFEREIYNQIGKTFTKETLKKLNVVISIITEVVGYLYHVKTWQDKFYDKVSEGVNSWEKEVSADILKDTIPKLIEANKKSVHACYDDLIENYRSINSHNRMNIEAELLNIVKSKQKIAELKQRLDRY